jgi:hypothetical protein
LRHAGKRSPKIGNPLLDSALVASGDPTTLESLDLLIDRAATLVANPDLFNRVKFLLCRA